MKSNVRSILKHLGMLEIIVYTIMIFLVWEVFSRLFMSPLILPPPSMIIGKMFDTSLHIHILATLEETIVGFLLGSSFGIVLGILMAYFRPLEKGVLPLIFSIKSIPESAIAPIAILYVGIGLGTKVLVVLWIVFFPILINTFNGLRTVNPNLLDLANSYHATKWQTFKKVRMPNSLPYIMTGLKITAPLAVMGAIIGELFTGDIGLTYVYLLASTRIQIPLMFAVIFWIAIIGLSFYGIALLLERMLLKGERR